MKLIPLLSVSFLFTLAMCSGNASSPSNDSVGRDTVPVQPAPVKKDIKALKVSFPSQDGLVITADSYFNADTLPWILLCHQAGFSRGEYNETAPLFCALGYNCLAIDQRSGDEVNGVKNETASRAKENNKPTEYLDAEQDLRAALNYLYENSKKPVIIIGSSYSCGLALKIAVGNPLVKAVLIFSPGEYYQGKLNVAETVSKLDKPVFVTAAKNEIPDAKKIYDAIPAKKKMLFEPTAEGIHGSRALWAATAGHEEYWSAVKEFLAGVK